MSYLRLTLILSLLSTALVAKVRLPSPTSSLISPVSFPPLLPSPLPLQLGDEPLYRYCLLVFPASNELERPTSEERVQEDERNHSSSPPSPPSPFLVTYLLPNSPPTPSRTSSPSPSESSLPLSLFSVSHRGRRCTGKGSKG